MLRGKHVSYQDRCTEIDLDKTSGANKQLLLVFVEN
jgi:hypothetical protein